MSGDTLFQGDFFLSRRNHILTPCPNSHAFKILHHLHRPPIGPRQSREYCRFRPASRYSRNARHSLQSFSGSPAATTHHMDCSLGNDIVDNHRVFLPLPPKSGIELLIELQRPGQSKPDKRWPPAGSIHVRQ